MLIRDVMTKEVISVSPNSSIEEVAQLLVKNSIHGIPVVENGEPIGIVTETDFFTKGSVTVYLPQYIDHLKSNRIFGNILSNEGDDKIRTLLDTKVADLMSSPCVTVFDDDNVSDFFKLIQEKKLISVPVINRNKKLVGIITLTDIVHLMSIEK